MTDTTEHLGYRFPAPDTGGWILGLRGPQCVLLAVGATGAVSALNLGAPLVAAAVFTAAAALALVPVDGVSAYTALAVGAGWWLRRSSRSWRRPLHTTATSKPALEPEWPAPLKGTRLHAWSSACWPGTEVGVASDSQSRTLAASLQLAGRPIALADPAEQRRLLDAWGRALAPFADNRSIVSAITITEATRPALGEAPAAPSEAEADGPVADYHRLLATAAPAATVHETLLTLTVPAGREPGQAADLLVEQLRLASRRLEQAGLGPAQPLNHDDLAIAVRRRLDPHHPVGAGGPADPAPMAWEADWRSVQVDGATHTAFWIAGWPRLTVGATWWEPLLLQPGSPRIVAVQLQPVPAAVSHRQIARDATRLATDEAQRQRGGWRITAAHRGAADTVAEREAELVAGHPEFAFCGLIVTAAPNPMLAARSSSEVEQAAAAAGLELRRLDGRHDLATVAALPLGRRIAKPVLS